MILRRSDDDVKNDWLCLFFVPVNVKPHRVVYRVFDVYLLTRHSAAVPYNAVGFN